MITTIHLRRGTAAQWTTADPILGSGEPGLETDTTKVKWGDGVTHWTALPYSAASAGEFAALAAQKGQPSGLATLDGGGFVPDGQIAATIARDAEVSAAVAAESTARDQAISTAINALINGAPGLLDTLGEIAAQLGVDESAAAALTTAVNARLTKALYDANSIVKADVDDTPVVLPVPSSTLIGRGASGVITALTVAQVKALLVLSSADLSDVASLATTTALSTAIASEVTARNAAIAAQHTADNGAYPSIATRVTQDQMRATRDAAWRGWDAMAGDPANTAPGVFIFGHSIVNNAKASITSRGFAKRVAARLPVLRKGTVVTTQGISGYTTTDLLGVLPGSLAGLSAGSVGAVLFMGLLNDYYYGIASATTKTNLLAIIAAVRAHSTASAQQTFVILLEWLRHDSLSTSTPEPWANYRTVAQQVADADPRTTILDLGARLGDPVTDTALGFWDVDLVHLSDKGHGAVTNLVLAELLRGEFPSSGGLLPSHVHILVPITPAIASTNWATPGSSQQVSTAYGAWVRESDGTQNASITFEMLGEAGNYSIALAHRKGSNRGQYTIAVDGATISSNPVMPIEGYNASAVDVINVVTTSIPFSGKHTVTITMAGKNASSSSYIGSLSAISWTRTGDLTT